jgi:hypothetical protein
LDEVVHVGPAAERKDLAVLHDTIIMVTAGDRQSECD